MFKRPLGHQVLAYASEVFQKEKRERAILKKIWKPAHPGKGNRHISLESTETQQDELKKAHTKTFYK